MPYNVENGEQMMEVKFRDAWYGDILRKPGIHLVPLSFKDMLPKSAKILSVLHNDEFEEDLENEEEIVSKHAHKMAPVALSELSKTIIKQSIADKRPKRHYRRKTNKE